MQHLKKMEMEGGDNDFAKAVLAGLDKCEELGYEDVELWSDSQRACGVLSDFETINMDDRNRMECMLLRFKSTRFKRLVSVQKPREIKDWSLRHNIDLVIHQFDENLQVSKGMSWIFFLNLMSYKYYFLV
ncbi:hypothetical protein DAI22_05g047601 [Oryza sativa Japonica Group]|nr:hypothetical protein DAI22_05g047601 [Oryza sativa Japonica Group]